MGRLTVVALGLVLAGGLALVRLRRTVAADDAVVDRWRATAGEWAGRDFDAVRGPIDQLLARLGPTPSSARAAETRRSIARFLLALVCAGVLALGAAARGWPRTLVFVGLAPLAGVLDALDAIVCATLLVYATRPPRALGRLAAGFTLGTLALGMIAPDRAFACALALGPMAAVASLVEPDREAALRRTATIGAALLETFVGLALLGPSLLGVDVVRAAWGSTSLALHGAHAARLSVVLAIAANVAVAFAAWRIARDPLCAVVGAGAAAVAPVAGPSLAAIVLWVAAARHASFAPARSRRAFALAASIAAFATVALALRTPPRPLRATRFVVPTGGRRDWVSSVPRSAGCFAADLRAARGPATVEVHALDPLGRTRSFASLVTLAQSLELPVPHGSRVVRVGASAPSGSRSALVLSDPRFGPCDCRPGVRLADELLAGRAERRASAPRASGDSIFLHPNPPGQARAEIVFPIAPCSDACLTAKLHLGEAPEPGDGVAFTIDVLTPERGIALAYVRLGPGMPDEAVDLPLDRWAGRRVWIRLGVEPGETPNFDWSSFVHPRVGTCRRDARGAP